MEIKRATIMEDLFERNNAWMTDNDDKSLFSTEELNKNQKIYADFWVNVRQIVSIKNHHSTANRKLGKFPRMKGSTDVTVKGDYIFDPLGIWRVRWSLVVISLVIYSVLLVPFRLGWGLDESEIFSIVDYCIDSIFFLDILVNFNTSYVDDESDVMIFEYDRIAIRYIRSWFIVDLLCCFPLDAVIEAASSMPTNYFDSFKLFRFLRFIRLTKLLRTNTVGNDDFFQLHRPLFNLLTLALQIMFICHVLACIWHYIAIDEPTSWVTDCLNSSETSNFDTYVASLYFVLVTMFTVGYGDIHAITTKERCFAMVLMLIGGIIFGAVLSNVTTLLEKQNPRASAHKEKMAELKDFLENSNVPLAFQHDAKEAFDYYLSKKTSFGESDIVRDLPRPTVLKLIHSVYARDIEKVKVFRTYDKSFVADLITHTRPFHVVSGEKIFEEGDVLNDIIFIVSGLISLSKFNGTKDVIVGVSRDGGYFGDFEYLKNTTCIATYSARKNSTLLSISHTVVSEAIENSTCGSQFRTELKERYKLFMKIVGVYSTASAAVGAKNLPVKKPLLVAKKSIFSNKMRSAINSGPLKKEDIWLDGVCRTRQFLSKLSLDLNVDSSSSTALKMYKVVTYGADGNDIVKEIEAKALMKTLIFHPNDPFRLFWDLFIACLVVVSVIEVSIDIAFDGNLFSSDIDIFFSALYGVDIFISFRTAYHEDEEDAYCIIPHRIYKRYLTSWFIIDFSSMVPIDQIVAAISSGGSGSSTAYNHAIKVLRVFRITKVFRILKLKSLASRLEVLIGLPSAVFDFASLLLTVLVFGHFIACMWWGFSLAISSPGTAWFEKSDIVGDADVRNGPLGLRYLWSLYWAIATMTTVGYGDVHASNTNERIVNIFILFVGAGVFGFIVANVSAINEAMSKRSTMISDRMRQVAEYLKEKECPKELSHEILRHFKHLYGIKNSLQGKEILNNLPVKVKNKILLYQHNKELQKISIFKYISNNSVRLYLFELMKPVFFHTGQAMITEGDQATDIIFLVSGSAIASKAHHRRIAEKKTDEPLFISNESKPNRSGVLMKSLQNSFAHHIKYLSPSGSPVNKDPEIADGFEAGSKTATDHQPLRTSFERAEKTIAQKRGSKNNGMHRMASAWFFDVDSRSKDDPVDMHDIGSWKNDPEELRRRNIVIVGEIAPASSVSCAYTISSNEIVRLIQDEPSVAVQFQHALSAAIQDQSHVMENANTTRSKKAFISSLKERFYKIRFDSAVGLPLPRTSAIKAATRSLLSIRLKPCRIYPSQVLGKCIPSLATKRTAKFPHHSLNHLENILSDRNIMRDSDSEEDLAPQVSSIKEKRVAANHVASQQKSASIFTVAKVITTMLTLHSKLKKKRVRCYSTSDLMDFENEKYASTRAHGWHDEAKGGECAPLQTHIRRQSFPSLDNIQWKFAKAHDGLL